MNKLTIKIEDSIYLNNDLEKYLNSLDGVISSKVDIDNDSIYIEYDSSIISLKVLKTELIMYLDIKKVPSILAFDKHTENNIKDTIVIKDLCCEYCLKGMIEELLEIDGIESAYTDFDYHNKSNVNIFISYNDKVINKEKINEISDKLNVNE